MTRILFFFKRNLCVFLIRYSVTPSLYKRLSCWCWWRYTTYPVVTCMKVLSSMNTQPLAKSWSTAYCTLSRPTWCHLTLCFKRCHKVLLLLLTTSVYLGSESRTTNRQAHLYIMISNCYTVLLNDWSISHLTNKYNIFDSYLSVQSSLHFFCKIENILNKSWWLVIALKM